MKDAKEMQRWQYPIYNRYTYKLCLIKYKLDINALFHKPDLFQLRILFVRDLRIPSLSEAVEKLTEKRLFLHIFDQMKVSRLPL